MDIPRDEPLEDGVKFDQKQAKEALEKEKVLRAVKQQALTMSTDIKDLLKNEWAGIIKSLEGEKEQAENDRKKNLSSAKND